MNPAAPSAINACARRRRERLARRSGATAASRAPSGNSQIRPCNSDCKMAGALSFAVKSLIQLMPSSESWTEYQGKSTKPAKPTASQRSSVRWSALKDRRRGKPAGSTRQRVDFLFPSLKQMAARLAGAELGEIVIDHFDVRQFRHLRRQRHAAIGRNGVLLDVEADFLAVDRQGPIDELFRGSEVVGALDDRDRADFVADAL